MERDGNWWNEGWTGDWGQGTGGAGRVIGQLVLIPPGGLIAARRRWSPTSRVPSRFFGVPHVARWGGLLVQVNTNPALHMDNGVLKALLPALVDAAVAEVLTANGNAGAGGSTGGGSASEKKAPATATVAAAQHTANEESAATSTAAVTPAVLSSAGTGAGEESLGGEGGGAVGALELLFDEAEGYTWAEP